MDESEADVLSHMAFPKERWQKIHSTNGLERLNGEVKRRRYMTLETIASLSDDSTV
ncbi:transposase-like protein [Rhodoblastus sphagnicola]|nr:transposase-like protein [Rhodoblastus sphagnicola]